MVEFVADSGEKNAEGCLTNSSCVQRNGALLATELNGEIVLLHVESGKYYGLDTIGGDIWRRLETPTRIEDLCAAMELDYRGAPEDIHKDVLAFLQTLVDAGAVLECRA